MKNQRIILFFILFLLTITELYADSDSPFEHNIQDSIDSYLNGWKRLSNIFISMGMLIGIISVVKALAEGSENARKMLYGWFIALIVWQIAFTII